MVDFCKEWIDILHIPEWEDRKISLSVLRLDRFHPFISGNKWLKLSLWMEKFQAGTYQGILTKGGNWSNHLHACGYACYAKKIPLTAIVRGNSTQETATLNDLKNWNTKLEFVNRTEYYNEDHWQKIANGQGYLYIPMGGDGPEGATGVEKWFNEAKLPCYDFTFCAAGTGTTATGLAKSCLTTRNLVVIEPGTGDESLTQRFIDLNQTYPQKNIHLIHFPGKFGKITPAIRECMNRWRQQHEVPLDFVYTAPLALAMEQMVNSDQIPNGSNILFVHTGGLQGNRSITVNQ